MELTPEHIEFADKLTSKFCNRWGCPSDDDVMASGRLGLVIAARTYDPSRKTKFSSWAYIKIRAQIVNYFREMLGKRRQVEYFNSLEFIPVDDNCLQLSGDGLERRVVIKDLIYKFKRSLTKHNPQKQLHRFQLLLEGMDAVDIANLTNVTESAVSQTLIKLNLKFNKFLEENSVSLEVY